MKTKIPDKIFGIDTKEAYDRYLEESGKSKDKRVEPLTTSSSLEDKTNFWSIPGVQYRNGIYTVDLSKSLLDNGSAKTQQQWSEYARQAISNNQFHTGDFPLYYALFNNLYKNRENPQSKEKIEEARKFVKDKMFEKWLMTLTRIRYTKTGKDQVIHNFGLQDQYEIQEDIIGLDEWAKDALNKKPYKAILGTEDVNEINNVFNWITGKNAYLWRVNSKPGQDDERVARFFADSDGADLGCLGNPSLSDSSLGVRAAKIKV